MIVPVEPNTMRQLRAVLSGTGASSGQIWTAGAGDPSWAAPAGGGGDGTAEAFTATDGQTVFTVSSPVASVSVVTVGGGENRYPATGAVSFTVGATDVTLSESIPAGLSVVVVYVPL